MRRVSVDKLFLGIVILLVVFGFFIYLSAALGLLARDSIKLSSVVVNHFGLGVLLGTLGLIIFSNIHYSFWRRHAFYILLLSLLLASLVFIPGIGFEHGGAKRWIHFANFSFQPSEFLKLAYIIYIAAWISGVREKVRTLKFGILPFIIVSAICGAIVLSEPDLDTFLVMLASGLVILIASGAKLSHLFMLGAVAAALFATIVFYRPYVMDRITTFVNPASDPLGSGYQIQQSLIAIGSGGWFGKGFGQSVQKFNYLPEPVGDSIFAVAAEEFGFFGAGILIALYLAFTFRGLRIATRANNLFGSLIVTGIITLIVVQSFLNIGAMIAVIPLSGLPLVFVSHGGTALAAALVSVGIVLNISKYVRK